MLSLAASSQRLVATLVVAGTISGTLVLIPTGAAQQSGSHSSLTALPTTGTTTPRAIPHPEDRRALAEEPVTYAMATTATLYDKYVPPPPPDPAPAAGPWTPPPGYAAINVPVYRQTRNLNCETGALQMALAAFGHYYSQDTLFAPQNPDLTPPVTGPNYTVVKWGNPYKRFVGNVNGTDVPPTGYGVYWPVILSIAQSHGVPNAYGGEWLGAGTIYAELAAGHPVEVWIETNFLRSPYRGVWTAWDGTPIRYSLYEHVVILSGVSQWSVRVNDPLNGTQYWVSKGTFETSWADFNNMAVVFR